MSHVTRLYVCTYMYIYVYTYLPEDIYMYVYVYIYMYTHTSPKTGVVELSKSLTRASHPCSMSGELSSTQNCVCNLLNVNLPALTFYQRKIKKLLNLSATMFACTYVPDVVTKAGVGGFCSTLFCPKYFVRIFCSIPYCPKYFVRIFCSILFCPKFFCPMFLPEFFCPIFLYEFFCPKFFCPIFFLFKKIFNTPKQTFAHSSFFELTQPPKRSFFLITHRYCTRSSSQMPFSPQSFIIFILLIMSIAVTFFDGWKQYCQIFVGETHQNAGNIPNDYKIYRMTKNYQIAVKFSKHKIYKHFFIPRLSQKCNKIGILV
jgi:hypothetical protein